MELEELIQIIKKYFAFIGVLVVIGAIIGASSSDFFSSGYNHSQTYFLADKFTQTPVSANLRSESYFEQEKPRNFTDTAVAILNSPDFKSQVLEGTDDLIVRKVAPQVIRLTYVSNSPDQNFIKLNEISDKFNQKIQDLQESSPSSQLKAIGQVGTPVYSALNSSTLAASGAILGAVFAIFIISLKTYFKI